MNKYSKSCKKLATSPDSHVGPVCTFRVQPFDSLVHMFIDSKEAEYWANGLSGGRIGSMEGASAFVLDFTCTDGDHVFAVYIPLGGSVTILMHESLHLAHFILEKYGVTVDESPSSSESQCYTQTHIYKLIKENLDLIKEDRKASKRKKPIVEDYMI